MPISESACGLRKLNSSSGECGCKLQSSELQRGRKRTETKEASMAENSTSNDSVFRVHFDVAWPVWAGGYPSQNEALQTFAENEADLRFAIEQRIKQLFGVAFELALFHHQGSGHRP